MARITTRSPFAEWKETALFTDTNGTSSFESFVAMESFPDFKKELPPGFAVGKLFEFGSRAIYASASTLCGNL